MKTKLGSIEIQDRQSLSGVEHLDPRGYKLVMQASARDFRAGQRLAARRAAICAEQVAAGIQDVYEEKLSPHDE